MLSLCNAEKIPEKNSIYAIMKWDRRLFVETFFFKLSKRATLK